MRYAAAILIMSLVFYVSFSSPAQVDTFPGNDVNDVASAGQSEQTERQKVETGEEGKEEMDPEDIFTSDQEAFHPEIFLKEFPPVTKKQKIVWAFILSETHPFL